MVTRSYFRRRLPTHKMRLLTRSLRLSHRFSPAYTHSMASLGAIQKLQTPLKDLVLGALPDGSPDFGTSEKDKAEVEGWIAKVAQGEIGKVDALKVLTSTLL